MPATAKKTKLPPMFGVKSSSISHVGYENGALYVTFAKGKSYRYPGVTREQFDALRKAESAGKHLQKHILSSFEGHHVPEDGE